jgi:hypothetical protein
VAGDNIPFAGLRILYTKSYGHMTLQPASDTSKTVLEVFQSPR